ncbi:MAG: TonB family protein [Steroidobacteraceae bacterium]|jgi:protein TonB
MASTLTKGGVPALLHREERAPARDRLISMVLLAALLHAIVILGLTFNDGAAGGDAQTPKLDVLLVTDEAPQATSNERAAYLAQRSQIGNGNVERAAPITSPASRAAMTRLRSAEVGTQHPAAGLRAITARQVLSSDGNSADIRYMGALSTGADAAASEPASADIDAETRNVNGDAAQLLLRGPTNAQRWVIPDTRASILAPYLAAWRLKVERIGNLNYPAAARDAGLSGSPVIEVEIGANGALLDARVRRRSGYGALDEAALRILKFASPFDPFPPDLAADYARMRFAYQWDFVAGTLQTGVVTVSSDRRPGP